MRLSPRLKMLAFFTIGQSWMSEEQQRIQYCFLDEEGVVIITKIRIWFLQSIKMLIFWTIMDIRGVAADTLTFRGKAK